MAWRRFCWGVTSAHRQSNTVPDLEKCNGPRQLQFPGLLAAVVFRVLGWHCMVCVRGPVVHLLALLVVEGPTLLHAPLRDRTCPTATFICFISALRPALAPVLCVLQVGGTTHGDSWGTAAMARQLLTFGVFC